MAHIIAAMSGRLNVTVWLNPAQHCRCLIPLDFKFQYARLLLTLRLCSAYK